VTLEDVAPNVSNESNDPQSRERDGAWNGLPNERARFRPTIPVTVRRLTSEQLADGRAETRSVVGPTGFSTRYVAALSMVDGHLPSELLADEVYELVLSTGHVLTGHFYPGPSEAAAQPLFLFIPSDAEAASTDQA